MSTLERPQWYRLGPTQVSSGEIQPDATGPRGDEELDGDTYSAYYGQGPDPMNPDRLACTTYYVLKTKTWNQPEVIDTWVVEEMYWVAERTPGYADMEAQDYHYESASPFFYESPEKAHEFARARADEDESQAWS